MTLPPQAPQTLQPPKSPWPSMSPLTAQDLASVGQFRIHGRLGSGGTGVVYGATDAAGLWAAVKVIGFEHGGGGDPRARFEAIAEPVSRLRARGIAPLISYDTEDTYLWYATPHVPGPTLAEQISGKGPLAPDLVRALAAGTAEALTVVHAAGLVHHDLKPSNVILAPDGPKLLDVGIARALGINAITHTGSLVGSPVWRAPENFHGPAGPRADVFAWASLVVYAATGRPAFGSGNAETLMYRVLREDPDLGGLPQELVEPVTRALTKDPANRPSAADTTRQLVGILLPGAAGTGESTAAVDRVLNQHWAPQTPPSPPSPAAKPSGEGPTGGGGQVPSGGYPPAALPPRVPTPAPPTGAGGGGSGRSRLPIVVGAAAIALLLVAALGVWFVSRPGEEPVEVADDGNVVNIGLIPWNEAIAVTHLWRVILEEKGYGVEVHDVDVAPAFEGIAEGEYDLFLDAWIPDTHAEYMDEYGDRLEDLGPWYGGATLHLTVPAYVTEVNSIADLPGNADLFDGQIIGIEGESGLMQRMREEVIPNYGLEDYELVESGSSPMVVGLEAAIAEQKPVVVTLWRPHIAYVDNDLKDLADPQGALGEGEEIHGLARAGFGADFPELNQWLSEFTLSVEELDRLQDLIINEYAGEEEQGARVWLEENPEFLERTLGADAEGVDIGG